MSMPKISVIVAVYNTELYLQKCIKSLINQTYSNLEIILVENGCTDSCPEICAAYAAKDDRIKVIHLSPNNGVSPALNAGLDAATGDWIAFLDSDDWVEPDTCEYLLTKVLKYAADIGICGHYIQYSDHKVFSGWNSERLLNTEQAIEQLLRDEQFNAMWGRLWRGSLFEGLRFPENEKMFGDAALAHHLFERAKRVVCLPRAKYYYFQRQGSIMRTQSLERPVNLYAVYKKRLCEMQEQWPQFYDLLADRCITYLLCVWHDYSKFPRKEQIKYQAQLQDMATFARKHYRTVPQYEEGGRLHKASLWLTQYAQWWSFGLIAFVDKLFIFRKNLITRIVHPPHENMGVDDLMGNVAKEDLPMLENPEPAFSENNIPVVFACSDVFIPHAAAAMRSLIDHTTASHNYDLIFLHTEISESNQRVMRTIVADFPNVSLRFFNIKEYIATEKLHVCAHFSAETFYRLLIPQFLRNYEKVIYLDSDLTILRDVAELFAVDLGENLLAAALDSGIISLCKLAPKIEDYLETVLRLKNPKLYFQAGVLVFNIREFNETFMPYELLNFAESHPFEWVDQDVLNVRCNGRVHILDFKWDVITYVRDIADQLKAESESLYKAYLESYEEPYIVHHAGPTKPWYDPQIDYAEVYWKYARQTPFYEITLYRMMQNIYAPLPATQPYRSRARKLADKLLPKGSRRRNLAKKILPKGSKRWEFCKKIYYKIFKR